MSLFVINVGNTRVQTGRWQDGRVHDFRQVPRADFDSGQLPERTPLAAACVVPEMRVQLAGRPVFWVGPEIETGLDLSLVDMSTFGADRLANAIALAKFASSLPAICVDCGTAITCEVVDRNRALRGGAIAPGRMLWRHALHAHTAQLPMVGLNQSTPPLIGTNTVDAIRCGVDRGAVGMVKEILAGIRQELGGAEGPCLVTGGDAEFFAGHLPELAFAGIDFTLRGIALAWEFNHAG